MTLKNFVRLGCVAVAVLAGSASAFALESITLRKIAAAGVISIGYRDGSVPFSYLDERRHPVGYSIDICLHIVDAIKAQLQLPQLTVKYVPVTAATRIPLVVNGGVDMECGVTTNNVERQKQVAFTLTTFVASSRLVSKRTQPVITLNDLRGKSVVSTVGTTSMQYLPELNAQRGLDVTILSAKDDAEAFRMVETDRATAYAMDDVLLRSSVANVQNPDDYVISDDALSVEPYGMMVNKADPEFKKLADAAITKLFASGDIRRLYRKWFESPIAPKGVNLRMPIHPSLEKAIKHPTDSGDPANYR
jgi:glutamate/aspartate transport system substrate-binding protein